MIDFTHSPLPWRVDIQTDKNDAKSVRILDANDGVVALMKKAGGKKFRNASAIVAAMNGKAG